MKISKVIIFLICSFPVAIIFEGISYAGNCSKNDFRIYNIYSKTYENPVDYPVPSLVKLTVDSNCQYEAEVSVQVESYWTERQMTRVLIKGKWTTEYHYVQNPHDAMVVTETISPNSEKVFIFDGIEAVPGGGKNYRIIEVR
jgi:hypothetical protein